MKRLIRKSQGVSLTETLISMTILLFASFASFSLLTSNAAKTNLIEQKVNLANQLDERVNEYLISNNFNDGSSGNTSFSQQSIEGTGLSEYSAIDSVSGLNVSQKAFE
ncbi:hypothetical protein LO80_07840 [Candidatus Francisella endociliophora]|uniref:Type II secretion system protein n=1 Tax=Candidatus Francisella endociliophora TaxID=653937 RepID=A0A097EQP5_9GAMM|nr:hypothetical protein [Francisella sp. FSC1006]AIT09887.1 hypothetical protein LO80_07840 [Francisella sp. FSC1006]